MKNKCEYIDKDSGCLVSFDGSCCKEECFTYRLLQLVQAKEQENKRLLEIINAKPLETVDIDSAFEIEKLKEQLQAKEQEFKESKEANDRILTTLNVITKSNIKLRQTLAEIQEIIKYDVYTTRADLCLRLNWIKKKISECKVEE